MMCKAMEDMRTQAAREAQYSAARRMLALQKLNIEEIAECSGLTVEEVAALAEKLSA